MKFFQNIQRFSRPNQQTHWEFLNSLILFLFYFIVRHGVQSVFECERKHFQLFSKNKRKTYFFRGEFGYSWLINFSLMASKQCKNFISTLPETFTSFEREEITFKFKMKFNVNPRQMFNGSFTSKNTSHLIKNP